MEYRAATVDDAVPIAELHAESWRLHYRGSYPDEYLDGDVETDRRLVWAARFADPGPGDESSVTRPSPPP